jgi:CRP/FNR family transcriptional regulator, anaerobic regulatory protein
MFTALFDHIRRFAPLDDEGETKLARFFEHRVLKKRGHFLTAGEVPGHIAFVQSGCLRLYHVNEFANERTLQFALEGWWLTDWDSFDRSAVSIFSIQAVEETTLAVLSRGNYEAAFDAVPVLERYFRKIFQRAAAAAQRRLYMTDTETAEDRYRNFQNQYPEFANRVPQYMLASFLGFSPELLSKIRARGRG